MRILISKKQFRIIISVILAVNFTIILMLLKENMQENKFISLCIISSLFIFAFQIFNIYRITGELFDPCIIFLASFYAFQNGQLLLIALNIDFNMFYVNTLKSLTGDVAFFSSLSNIVAGLAGMIVAKEPSQQTVNLLNEDLNSESNVARAAGLGVILIGAVSYSMIFIKFFKYALSGGYNAVRSFEGTMPSIVAFADFMYVPFAFLFIIYTKNKRTRKCVIIFTFIWFVLTALSGDRTTGIAGLLILAYLAYLDVDDTKKRRKEAVKLVIVGIFLIVFIKVAFAFRTGGSVLDAITGSNSLVVGLFEELGFSVFPLFMMMNIVPHSEKFLYGKQYLLSFIAGIFPSSLDFSGTLNMLTQDWGIYNKWIEEYYSQYKFGVGFSLNAEAYINFGWLGIIAIFFLMLVVFSNLTKAFAQKRLGSKYGFYKLTVLLFVWMTLPRRSSYYIWNSLFWCVFMMGLYLRIMCSVFNILEKITNDEEKM